MKEEAKIYKQIFTIRKGGENGEKYFITVGNMVLSSKLHDTEDEAVKELEELSLESVSRMLVAVMCACDEMIKEKIKNKEK